MATLDISKLAAYLEKQQQDLEAGVPTAIFEVSSDIVNRTPVDEGGAKGSLTPSINKMETNERIDPTGRETINMISNTTNKLQLGDTFYLLSNLEYMPVLEYGLYGTGSGSTSKTTSNGFSSQAPNGMFRVSLDNFERHLDEALK